MGKMRKQLEIPKSLYLAAVERQERRAWAKWTDPYDRFRLHERLRVLREEFGLPRDDDSSKPPVPPQQEDADPELFDTAEYIAKDEALIRAYLADNPTEQRRPMARGTNHDELLSYWKTSSEGRSYFAQRDLQFRPTLERLRDKYLTEQSGSPSQSDDLPAPNSGK